MGFKIIIYIFFCSMFFTNLSSKEFYLNKYLKKWPNCNLSNYEIKNKKDSDGNYIGDQVNGEDIFIINNKQKKVKVRQSKWYIQSKNLDKLENKVCPYFIYLETYYKKERLFTISILGTTLTKTEEGKVPYVVLVESHRYFENYAKYKGFKDVMDGIPDNGVSRRYMTINIGKKKELEVNKYRLSKDVNDVIYPYIYLTFKTKSKKIQSFSSEPWYIEDPNLENLFEKKFQSFDNLLTDYKNTLFTEEDFALMEKNFKDMGYIRYQTRD